MIGFHKSIWLDQLSNPVPLALQSDVLLTVLCNLAQEIKMKKQKIIVELSSTPQTQYSSNSVTNRGLRITVFTLNIRTD